MTTGYKYVAPIYKPRPHTEIIETWLANFIKEHEPFKGSNRYGSSHKIDLKYQFAFMGLLLFWQLILEVRNIATDQAYKMGYEMMGEQK